jgi:hypothetical protein
MLKEPVDFGEKLFELVRTSREHDERINKLASDHASLTRRFDALAEEVHELSFQLRQDRENRARERELLRLQLENVLLRFERRLPPAEGARRSAGTVLSGLGGEKNSACGQTGVSNDAVETVPDILACSRRCFRWQRFRRAHPVDHSALWTVVVELHGWDLPTAVRRQLRSTPGSRAT